MTTFLTRIATAVFSAMLICTAVTQVQAQIVQKILHTQPQVGVKYTIRENPGTGNGAWKYLNIQRVIPGTPAERAGLQSGDWIYRVQNSVVDSRARFDAAVNAAPDRASFQVKDKNNGQWTTIDLELRSIGQPEPPNGGGNGGGGNGGGGNGGGGNGGGGNGGQNQLLTGIWHSSGGGTVHFRGGNPNQIRAESNVPWVGQSDLVVTPNGNGTYNFTYQQRGGFRDSGYGKLTPRGGNTIDGYLVNGLGIRADFVLSR